MGRDHGAGIGPQQRREIGECNPPQPICRNKAKLHAPLFQPIERPQHRIMLQVCRDDMVARTKQTEDRRIQCFRRIAGKADPLRAAAAEKVRQLLPGVVNHPGGAEGAAIDTPATVAQRLHRLGHRLNDAGRPPQRRGRIIQINHAWTPFRAVRTITGG